MQHSDPHQQLAVQADLAGYLTVHAQLPLDPSLPCLSGLRSGFILPLIDECSSLAAVRQQNRSGSIHHLSPIPLPSDPRSRGGSHLSTAASS